ncbi:MAG: hypothetical protein ACJA0Q_001112 [Saprospiraceae bacterium]|jgi:hypothetical protein
MRKNFFVLVFTLGLIGFSTHATAGIDSCKTVLDSTGFANFIANIAQQDFDDAKITIISNSLETKCFSCDQIKTLLELFSFEEDKISIVKKAYGRVFDPRNFDVIYTVFEFDSSKNEIKQHIDGLLKTN